MIRVPVFDQAGNEVGQYEFDESALGGRVRKVLLREAVLMYEANRRVGTASTKTRSEVAGNRQKLYRQKGTGRARAGTRQANLRRGGGVAHGPRPRDYSYRLPRRAVRLATQSALLSKFLDHEAVVVEELTFEAPRTAQMARTLQSLGIRESCLIALPDTDPNVVRSARNIPGCQVTVCTDLNAYDLLRRKRLMLTRAAIEALTRPAAPQGEIAPSADTSEDA